MPRSDFPDCLDGPKSGCFLGKTIHRGLVLPFRGLPLPRHTPPGPDPPLVCPGFESDMCFFMAKLANESQAVCDNLALLAYARDASHGSTWEELIQAFFGLIVNVGSSVFCSRQQQWTLYRTMTKASMEDDTGIRQETAPNDHVFHYLKHASARFNLSSPKPGHTTGRSGRCARQGGGAGSGRTGCQQICFPRKQASFVFAKASKKIA